MYIYRSSLFPEVLSLHFAPVCKKNLLPSGPPVIDALDFPVTSSSVYPIKPLKF